MKPEWLNIMRKIILVKLNLVNKNKLLIMQLKTEKHSAKEKSR